MVNNIEVVEELKLVIPVKHFFIKALELLQIPKKYVLFADIVIDGRLPKNYPPGRG